MWKKLGCSLNSILKAEYFQALKSLFHTIIFSLNYSSLVDGDLLSPPNDYYEAYEEDIARVEVYFKSATVTEIHREPSMTWIDYFANLGGLFGLSLGLGIIFLFEFIWYLMVTEILVWKYKKITWKKKLTRAES